MPLSGSFTWCEWELSKNPAAGRTAPPIYQRWAVATNSQSLANQRCQSAASVEAAKLELADEALVELNSMNVAIPAS